MTLVWTLGKDIKIYSLYINIYITINHDLVNITYRIDHEETLIGSIDHLRIWLVLQDALRILDCHNEMALHIGEKLFSMLEKKNMPYMQHIIYSKR